MVSEKAVVIAHRGASGYLPEHTLPAKALAYAMGADFLEQDIVATADDELIVIHDVHLDRTTDVARRFPDRARDDGRFYARDFTLAEIRHLAAHERVGADGSPVYADRYPLAGETFSINTLSEELAFIQHLRDRVGQPVGIYPEIKHPAAHRAAGVDISRLVVQVLAEHGYRAATEPVYLQCFDERELIRIREDLGCEMRLVQLIGENDWGESDTDYDNMKTESGLRRVADTCNAIGPWINQLYEWDESTKAPKSSGLVEMAHGLGLEVHPYTARRDSLPPGFTCFDDLLAFLLDDLRVDGLFSDFPDLVAQYIAQQ